MGVWVCVCVCVCRCVFMCVRMCVCVTKFRFVTLTSPSNFERSSPESNDNFGDDLSRLMERIRQMDRAEEENRRPSWRKTRTVETGIKRRPSPRK